MCNPVIAVMAISAVIAADAAKKQAKAQRDALRFNSQVDNMRANQALEKGKQEVFKSRLRQADVAGAQRAAFAARGLSLAEGSPLNILMDTQYLGDLDAAILEDNAEREAWGYRVNAGFEAHQASQIRPGQEAATSLLTSAGAIAQAAK